MEFEKSIWKIYLSREYLLQHILTKKTEYAHDYDVFKPGLNNKATAESRKYIKISIENCWGKLDEYYQLLDILSAYIVALALNPSQKFVFIERKWSHKPAWIRDAKKTIKY